ncbi:MAG: barstar family protein [Anaerolineae bacterium]|jgi:hypothetical protein
MKWIRMDTKRIRGWATFHQEFKKVFGFPDFYGANMDAWIDCMSYLRDPDAGMSQITVGRGEQLMLEVVDSNGFRARCPEQFEALIECTAFVNRRYVSSDSPPMLALILL